MSTASVWWFRFTTNKHTLPECLEAIGVAVSGVNVPVTVLVALDACTDGSAAVVGDFSSVAWRRWS
ncbi:hypothetical protein [Mycolicibacterium chubuense]|uniref:hypothetical protein n=1 Tax=Mycolicibacterium chubuense TaxID=1800 RepID=UPI0007C809F2|nr:hypothetical protein [Mycolicibacterium chubuense]